MLHTFNCTAYEIADCSYKNLNAFNIIGFNNINEKTATTWCSIDLSTVSLGENLL
jgi:hypothetical protein